MKKLRVLAVAVNLRREARECRQWRVRREVVGRGGLEPPTSALSARRSAS